MRSTPGFTKAGLEGLGGWREKQILNTDLSPTNLKKVALTCE